MSDNFVKKIFICATEQSGDNIGKNILKGLKNEIPSIENILRAYNYPSLTDVENEIEKLEKTNKLDLELFNNDWD